MAKGDAAGKWSRNHAARVGRNGQAKRSVLLAAQIENEIIEQGWPVGAILGSEAELIERYAVSRAVFREAIRLLEHHFVAEMRRGRSGGLAVTKPDPAAVADAAALFLRYRSITPADLFEVRRSLETTSVRLAAERSTEADVARLRELAKISDVTTLEELASRSASFHEAIAEISGNPAVHLFVQVMTMLTEAIVDHSPAEDALEGVHRAHSAIAEAIAAGDAGLAQRRMSRHFEAMTDVGFPLSRD